MVASNNELNAELNGNENREKNYGIQVEMGMEKQQERINNILVSLEKFEKKENEIEFQSFSLTDFFSCKMFKVSFF